MDKDALWIVEYIPHKEAYRVSRFAKPEETIEYVDKWEYAVQDIAVLYWDVVRVILIRKQDGSVYYRAFRKHSNKEA